MHERIAAWLAGRPGAPATVLSLVASENRAAMLDAAARSPGGSATSVHETPPDRDQPQSTPMDGRGHRGAPAPSLKPAISSGTVAWISSNGSPTWKAVDWPGFLARPHHGRERPGAFTVRLSGGGGGYDIWTARQDITTGLGNLMHAFSVGDGGLHAIALNGDPLRCERGNCLEAPVAPASRRQEGAVGPTDPVGRPEEGGVGASRPSSRRCPRSRPR
jgi:hypothetical protein